MRTRSFGLAGILFALAVLAAAQPGATAPPGTVPQTPAADDIAATHARLASELMSPFCRGLTLADCPTSGAAEMRTQIRTWLEEGRSEDWIKDTLVAEWGEWILGAPRFRGLGLIAWIAPAVVLLVGFVFVGRMLARRQPVAAGGPVAGPPPAPADEVQRRVEQELAELDR